MKNTILITGGCRSGKSCFALNYANRRFTKKLYLATGEVLDEEMALRVENHKKMRGPEWLTLEEPLEVVDKIKQHQGEVEVILLDCLTLWLSNLIMKGNHDSRIMEEVDKLEATVKQTPASLLMVSNEVGMGIVPADPLSRRFRDLAGMTNQRLSAAVDTVVLMVSGIPLYIKGAE